MDIYKLIERANYLAKPDDVTALAAAHLEAQQAVSKTHGIYFRILLASTQHAICGKTTLRARSGEGGEIDTAKHLECFEAVNASLYAAVLRATVPPELEASERLSADEARRRSLERNRRTNFARSAATTLRQFIKRGGNILRLAVPAATKSAVAGMTPAADGDRAPSEDRARKKVQAAAQRIIATAEVIAESDRTSAISVLQDTLSRVAGALLKFGGKTTTKPDVAVEEHRLLKTPNGTFWPAAAVQ